MFGIYSNDMFMSTSINPIYGGKIWASKGAKYEPQSGPSLLKILSKR